MFCFLTILRLILPPNICNEFESKESTFLDSRTFRTVDSTVFLLLPDKTRYVRTYVGDVVQINNLAYLEKKKSIANYFHPHSSLKKVAYLWLQPMKVTIFLKFLLWPHVDELLQHQDGNQMALL